jgi:hypothetical protein
MRFIWISSSKIYSHMRLIHCLHLFLITCTHLMGIHMFTLCSTTGTSNSKDLLSHCVTQENHMEFIISTLFSEEAITSSSSMSHNDAPNSWKFTRSPCAQPHECPTQHISFLTALHRRIIWSSSQISIRRRPSLCSSSISDRNHTPISGALSQVCVLEYVSRNCNHQDKDCWN